MRSPAAAAFRFVCMVASLQNIAGAKPAKLPVVPPARSRAPIAPASHAARKKRLSQLWSAGGAFLVECLPLGFLRSMAFEHSGNEAARFRFPSPAVFLARRFFF